MQLDGRIAQSERRRERLGALLRVALHEQRGGLEHLARESVRLGEIARSREAERALEAPHQADVTPREAVDALPIVADAKERRVDVLGQQRLQQPQAAMRQVLKLVDDHSRERRAESVLLDGQRCRRDHVVEVDFTRRLQLGLVLLQDAPEDAKERRRARKSGLPENAVCAVW